MKQTTFASAAWEKKGKVTRRERFLAEMDQVIPWASILELIEPYYPKAGNGTQPMPMQRMLRIYFMQQWFNLSDPAMEDALYDSESMRRFAGVELIDDAVPDESTILRFRHLLERHQLTQKIFELVRGLLEQKRLLLKSGTIVDATIIDAPPSTKNEAKSRDPEMKQGKKNSREWHFGMKAHVGTDLSGLVHTLVTTHAGACDFSQLPKLLHGAERELYGDQAYWSELHRVAAKEHGVRYRVNRRPNAGRPLTEHQRKLNRLRSATRARGEHAFNVVKQAPLGLQQGALPRAGEEHRTPVCCLCLGEPVHGPTSVDANTAGVSLLSGETRRSGLKRPPQRLHPHICDRKSC